MPREKFLRKRKKCCEIPSATQSQGRWRRRTNRCKSKACCSQKKFFHERRLCPCRFTIRNRRTHSPAYTLVAGRFLRRESAAASINRKVALEAVRCALVTSRSGVRQGLGSGSRLLRGSDRSSPQLRNRIPRTRWALTAPGLMVRRKPHSWDWRPVRQRRSAPTGSLQQKSVLPDTSSRFWKESRCRHAGQQKYSSYCGSPMVLCGQRIENLCFHNSSWGTWG